MVNHAGHGISALAVRFAKDRVPTTNKRWKVMNKVLVVLGALALSVSVSAPALAGWGNGSAPHEQPQADDPPNSDSYDGAPGGFGGGGFGESQEGDNPSGTNGNQSKNGKTKNDDRGNAGGPGDGEGTPE
jgi:hypothetical protein